MEKVLVILGLALCMLGVIMVYDARIITKKLFSFGDQNEASTGLKILGFIVAIAGALVVFFQMQ